MAVRYGMKIKLQHQQTGKRLHSHPHNYPEGTKQQQVTGLDEPHNDEDFWIVKPQFKQDPKHFFGRPVKNGDVIRLEHAATRKNLHSHATPLFCRRDQHEVTCYLEGEQGDENDNWRVECDGVLQPHERLRLIHVKTNCALHSHNNQYPFGQQEVTGYGGRDDNDFWKVCEHHGGEPAGHGHHHPPPHHGHHPPPPHHGHHGGGKAVSFGTLVKLKHQLTGKNLHSHPHNYPAGSKQQQVTALGEPNNDDDWWFFKVPFGRPEHGRRGHPIKNGDVVRLEHQRTRRNLHSHGTKSPYRGEQHEVTCFAEGKAGDENDNWRIECGGHLNFGERFRLIHVKTNCALHSHDIQYPFGQQEVTGFAGRDDNDYWQVGEVKDDVAHIGQGIGGIGIGGGMHHGPGHHAPAHHQPHVPAFGEIHVGKHSAKHGEPKIVQLPHDGLIVDPDTSKRGDGSGDKFAVAVFGRQLTVWRIDGPPGGLPKSGWGQDLKMSWRKANPGEQPPPPFFPAGIPPDVQYKGGAVAAPMPAPGAPYGAPPGGAYGGIPPSAPYAAPPGGAYGAPPGGAYPGGAPYGAPPGAPYGAPPGAPYGAPPGAPYGAPPGAPYGAPPGAPYGAPPGAPYGAPPGGPRPGAPYGAPQQGYPPQGYPPASYPGGIMPPRGPR